MVNKEDYREGFKNGYNEGFKDGWNTRVRVEEKEQIKKSYTKKIEGYE